MSHRTLYTGTKYIKLPPRIKKEIYTDIYIVFTMKLSEDSCIALLIAIYYKKGSIFH